MARLKEMLTRNIGLKILSLVCAFLVYLVVVNVSNPETTGTKTVSVEVINENVLTAVGKAYEFTNGSSVVVSYTVRTRDAYKISSSDFRAYVDMNNLYDVTGSVPVSIEVVNNKDLFTSTPTCKPVVLRVSLEDIVRSAIPVTAYTDGTPADGYTVGTVEINPTSITVRGPYSLTKDIAYAEIYPDVEGANSNVSGSAKAVFYDSNGHQLDVDEKVSLSRSTVDYSVQILTGKTVPVTYEVSGNPADGYSYTGVDSSVKEVTILGNKDEIANINSIQIPSDALNIEGAQDSKTVNVDISQYIPDDVVIVTDDNADVTIMVEGQVEKTFIVPASEITKNGTEDKYNYSVGPGAVEVVLTGLKADLDALNSNMLGAVVDVGGLSEGSHLVVPTFTIPDSVSVKSASEVAVSVTVNENYVESETAATEAASDEQTSASGGSENISTEDSTE